MQSNDLTLLDVLNKLAPTADISITDPGGANGARVVDHTNVEQALGYKADFLARKVGIVIFPTTKLTWNPTSQEFVESSINIILTRR